MTPPPHHVLFSPGYSAMLLVGLGVGAVLWARRTRGRPELIVALAGGLLGAVIGAKLGYIFAEAPVYWGTEPFWPQMLVGKTVLGALLGGYGGVELGKWLVGFREPTGDHFALAVPIGLVLGRVGCLVHGCCHGIACGAHRWSLADGRGGHNYPAAATELAFNLVLAGVLTLLYRRGRLPGQLFHVYLVGYGLFRFGHEFVRDTPTLVAGLSGYHLLALGLVLLGGLRYAQRVRRTAAPRPGEPAARPTRY